MIAMIGKPVRKTRTYTKYSWVREPNRDKGYAANTAITVEKRVVPTAKKREFSKDCRNTPPPEKRLVKFDNVNPPPPASSREPCRWNATTASQRNGTRKRTPTRLIAIVERLRTAPGPLTRRVVIVR